jgi:hypothetical protein
VADDAAQLLQAWPGDDADAGALLGFWGAHGGGSDSEFSSSDELSLSDLESPGSETVRSLATAPVRIREPPPLMSHPSGREQSDELWASESSDFGTTLDDGDDTRVNPPAKPHERASPPRAVSDAEVRGSA